MKNIQAGSFYRVIFDNGEHTEFNEVDGARLWGWYRDNINAFTTPTLFMGVDIDGAPVMFTIYKISSIHLQSPETRVAYAHRMNLWDEVEEELSGEYEKKDWE